MAEVSAAFDLLAALVRPIVKAAVSEALAERAGEPQLAPLWEREDVRRYIGCSLPTVDALVEAGMPVMEVSPRIVRFEPVAVCQWLRDRKGVSNHA